MTDCPDGATCHQRCLRGCWRVTHEDPLPSAFPSGKWSTWVRREYGTLVQDGQPDPSPQLAAAPAASSGEVPTRAEPPIITTPPDGPPERRMVGPDGEGIPIIDLYAQLQNLDQTVASLRAWARVMHSYADQATQYADGLTHLRDTLQGDT